MKRFVCILIITISAVVSISAQSRQDTTVYTTVETSPEFPGGLAKLGNYLGTHVNMSEDGAGRLYVSFIVEKDGSLTHIKVLKSSLPQTNIIDVLRNSPKWIPVTQNKKTVRCRYNMPLTLN